MKKKVLLIAMLALLLIPVATLAKEEDTTKYSSKNLIETLTEEDIEVKYSDYKETDKQTTIYLFRGSGCAYCRKFLEYLNDISEEYGKYFKLVSYEVWTNTDNANLYEEVADFLGQSASGVPFIVIGEEVFQGYSEQYNEAIETAIKSQYDAKDKYDVMEELEKSKAEAKRKEFFQSGKFAVISNIFIVLIATIVIILFTNKKLSQLENKLDKIENKLEVVKEKPAKEEKNDKIHKEPKEKKKTK